MLRLKLIDTEKQNNYAITLFRRRKKEKRNARLGI